MEYHTMNLRLILVLLFALLFSQSASAQTPLVILTPDGVTGEVIFQVNTATNDSRLTETCIYRVDAGSPDPSVPLVCAPTSEGRPPVAGEEAPSGEGVVLELPLVVSILPEDQTFGARNIVTVEGSQIQSILSSNSAVLPFGVVAPLFVVIGSE